MIVKALITLLICLSVNFLVSGLRFHRISKHFVSHALIGERSGSDAVAVQHSALCSSNESSDRISSPRFDLEVAVMLAGYAFDAYNEPVIQ
jgi:hypothetical protein